MSNSRPKTNHLSPAQGLLGEFTAASYEQWRAEAERLLEGADFEKALTTKLPEGLIQQPVYRHEDITDLAHLSAPPGTAPFVRGRTEIPRRWRVAQRLDTSDPQRANELLLRAIERGQDSVIVEADGLGIDELALVFLGVDLDKIPVIFETRTVSMDSLNLYAELAWRGDVPLSELGGSVAFDPIGASARGADLELQDAFEDLAKATNWAVSNAPAVGTLWMRGEVFADSGAHAVQELAFTLANGVELLRQMDSRGIAPEIAARRMRGSFSLGSRFFIEAAKLRAARLLWSRILQECGVAAGERGLWIHARTAISNQTVFDRWVNMLRATTEAFCGAIAGVDSLEIDGFDAAVGGGDERARRVARNTHIVLAEEAKLAGIADPAGGSYYVERLTADLAAAAWGLFQKIEAMGGLAKALENGFVQAEIATAAESSRADLAMRKRVLVGTNKYPLASDDAKWLAESPKTAEGTLPTRRLAEGFENLRIAVAWKSTVHIATLGDSARYQPRLDFARSFFEIGGFDVSVVEAAKSDAPIVVLCGLDESYEREAVEAAKRIKKLRPETILILVGHPDDVLQASLEASGVERFIHLRSDILEVLGELARRLGVSS